MAFLPQKLTFFLQNSMYRRPPALTGLQKSGQKIACSLALFFILFHIVIAYELSGFQNITENVPCQRFVSTILNFYEDYT